MALRKVPVGRDEGKQTKESVTWYVITACPPVRGTTGEPALKACWIR